jgi:archaellum component FlaF (FlaF/FlaG flagellin family)
MHSLSIFFMVTFSVNNQVLFPLAALTVSIPSEWETVWISICGGSHKRLFVPSKTLNLSDFI